MRRRSCQDRRRLSRGPFNKKTRNAPFDNESKKDWEDNTMRKLAIAAAIGGLMIAAPALAYDGQHCKAPGNCWEPKPGFPEKVAGSKYDPKHDPKELAKQGDSEREMEARNAKRVANFRKTGTFVYDVKKISE